MSLKFNIPVKCFATTISYYKFVAPHDMTAYFDTVSGVVEDVELRKGVAPNRDFVSIEPTAREIKLSEGDVLYVTVKGRGYSFCMMEKHEITTGNHQLINNLPYRIAPSNRNLVLKIETPALLELEINGNVERLDVENSEVTFNCSKGVKFILRSNFNRIKVEVCQQKYS